MEMQHPRWVLRETFFLGTEVTLTAHPGALEVVSWQGCDSPLATSAR